MFAQILAAIHQFARLTVRSLKQMRRNRPVALELIPLEERAVPAAEVLLFAEPPEMVAIADFAPAAVIPDAAVKPIVRVDLVPFSSNATRAEYVFDSEVSLEEGDETGEIIAKKDRPAEETNEVVQESNTEILVVSEADLLAVKMTEELRQMANVGA